MPPASIASLRPVAGVHRGEELGARHVHVAQCPRGPGGGLVGVQHRGGGQQLPDPVHERREQPGGLAPDAGHEPGRDVHPGQRGDQLRGAGDRQVVRADRQRGLRVHSRPVLHPPGHPGRRQPDRDLPAVRARISRRPGTRSPPAAGAGTPRTPAVSAPCPAPARRSGHARSSRTRPARTTPCHRDGVTASASRTARRAACPAGARTCRAATGPAASSYTGCPRTAAWMTSRSPCPDAAAAPRPARPAPRSARPARPAARRPAHRGPRPPRAAGRSVPPAPRPAHAATPPHQRRAHAGYRTHAALHHSRRTVIKTTRRAGFA